jgi:hypothetical protein
MSNDDIEHSLHDRLQGAIDPIVPGPNATARVMDAVAGAAAQGRARGGAGTRFGRGLATVLVASIVVVLVGGALGLSLALRGRSVTPGPSTHTTAPAPLSTPTPSPLPSPTPSPTPSPVAGVAACEGSMLTSHFASPNGAAGTLGGEIVLQNSSDAPCMMDGYTNLRGYAGGTATQLGVTHDITGFFKIDGVPITPELITLRPGEIAYVAFVYSDVQSSSTACPSFTALLVTPPQGRNEVRMNAVAPFSTLMMCRAHGAAIWVDEAAVSLTSYFALDP